MDGVKTQIRLDRQVDLGCLRDYGGATSPDYLPILSTDICYQRLGRDVAKQGISERIYWLQKGSAILIQNAKKKGFASS